MVAPALVLGVVQGISGGLVQFAGAQPSFPPLDVAGLSAQVQELNVRAQGLPQASRAAVSHDPITGEVIVSTIGQLESGVTDLLLSERFSQSLGIPLFPPPIRGPTRTQLGLTRESLLAPGFEVVAPPPQTMATLEQEAAAVRTLRPAATRPISAAVGGPCAGATTARARALCSQGGAF